MKRLLLTIFLVLSAAAVQSQDIKITAVPENNTAILNQEFQVEVTIEGENANNNLTPKIANIPGLRILQNYTNVSSSFQVINGRMTASVTYTIYFMPEKPGDFTVGPFSVEYKGKKYQSNAFKLKVVKETTQVPGKEAVPQGQNIFLAVIPDKKEAYTGEGITLIYKLYFQQNVRSFSFSKLPPTTGFWVEDYQMPRQPQTRTEVLNNQRYGTAVLKKMVLFPTSSGTFTIGPLDVEVEVPATKRKNRRNTVNDFFNDSFFERTVKRRISSGSVQVKIKPLPDTDVPLDFSGLVGEFDISASVDKTTVKTDEALTYTIEISGLGNVKIFDRPILDISPDFEIYEPKINEKVDKLENITGRKTFEYVLIPRSEGTHKIKPVNLSYFNAEKGMFVTVSTKEFTIKVLKGDKRTTPAVTGDYSRKEITMLGSDIRFIKTTAKTWRDYGDIFYKDRMFLILLVLPLVLLGVVFSYSRHFEKMSSDVQYARNKKASKTAQKRLSKARFLLKEKKPEFYTEMTKALEDYIADKLNISAAGIISGELRESLKKRNVNDELIENLIKTVDECNFARFSPDESHPAVMENIYNRGSDLITKLEKRLK